MEKLFLIVIALPPLVVAVILHEVAHGWVAEKMGDPTARAQGRITLNPIRHIDPFMTFFLPLMLILLRSPVIFGGAKPVPINPRMFKNPRRGMLWVALAGPAVNFVLALVSGVLFWAFFGGGLTDRGIPHIPTVVNVLVSAWLVYSAMINTVLAVFNLVPVPPLDGGRVAVGILPLPLARALARLEPYGLWIVAALLLSGMLDAVLGPAVGLVQKTLSGF